MRQKFEPYNYENPFRLFPDTSIYDFVDSQLETFNDIGLAESIASLTDGLFNVIGPN